MLCYYYYCALSNFDNIKNIDFDGRFYNKISEVLLNMIAKHNYFTTYTTLEGYFYSFTSRYVESTDTMQ